MNAGDIAIARAQAKAQPSAFCKALRVVLPVLEQLRANARGWKFWMRWGMDALIGALREYDERCVNPEDRG